MRVFVAGAGGAVGRRLVPKLVERGHEVVAATRNAGKLEALKVLGARAVVMDGLDAASVGETVARAEPDVVVHQMTALAGLTDLRRFDEAFAGTNELRRSGTDHLLAAADALGVPRVVAQSFTGWPNERTGSRVKTELDPLDPHPPAKQQSSLDAIRYLEKAVTSASSIEGIVLRYGTLYGPGTAVEREYPALIRARKFPLIGAGSGIWSFLHIDDAAAATVIAVERGASGIYNVVDNQPAEAAEWLPYLAMCLGAKPPRRIPRWLAWSAVGEVGISMMTMIRGSSNAKARRDLGWEPNWQSWREGFLHIP